jgi:hypothetical protein
MFREAKEKITSNNTVWLIKQSSMTIPHKTDIYNPLCVINMLQHEGPTSRTGAIMHARACANMIMPSDRICNSSNTKFNRFNQFLMAVSQEFA